MTDETLMTEPRHVAAAMWTIDYLLDLFTVCANERYSREQVLVILNTVRHDPELFEAELVGAYDEAKRELGDEQS